VMRPGPTTRRQASLRRRPGIPLAPGWTGHSSLDVDIQRLTAIADDGCRYSQRLRLATQ